MAWTSGRRLLMYSTYAHQVANYEARVPEAGYLLCASPGVYGRPTASRTVSPSGGMRMPLPGCGIVPRISCTGSGILQSASKQEWLCEAASMAAGIGEVALHQHVPESLAHFSHRNFIDCVK